jgi:hypothetical protein
MSFSPEFSGRKQICFSVSAELAAKVLKERKRSSLRTVLSLLLRSMRSFVALLARGNQHLQRPMFALLAERQTTSRLFLHRSYSVPTPILLRPYGGSTWLLLAFYAPKVLKTGRKPRISNSKKIVAILTFTKRAFSPISLWHGTAQAATLRPTFRGDSPHPVETPEKTSSPPLVPAMHSPDVRGSRFSKRQHRLGLGP